MAWYDFFFGPPRRERFAGQLMVEMQRCGVRESLRYNPEQFVVERGGGALVNLTNIYQEYCNTPQPQREEVLNRFVRGCIGMGNFELPTDFADVQPDVLPVVRSRFYLESVQLQSQARGGKGLSVPQMVFGEHLSLSLVYDLPQAMRSIGQDDLNAWDVTFYQALEAAKHNLEQLGNVAFANINNRCFASATGDNYDASRIVLVELIRRLPVRGEYIAMIPNRDSLLITGSEDEQGLGILCKLARESFQQPRPISTIALRLEGDHWLPWLPEAPSPLRSVFQELALRTLAGEYAEQAKLLEQLQPASETGRPIGAFNVVQDTETRAYSSYCLWTEGSVSLLPRTDVILLMRADDGSASSRSLGAVDWDWATRVAGPLMQLQDLYPERWLVREFPSDEQLREMLQ